MEGGVPNVGIFDPKNIRGKFAKFNPEHADDPDFMKAEGGAVQHFQAGGLSKLAKYAHSQNPKVAQALEEYLKGNISQEERIRIMNQFLPMRQWNELPPNYTDEQIRNALLSNKQSKALAPVPEGMRVGNRLDIPAYTQHGVYVDTTHDAAGKPISYNRTGHLKDVEFSSKPNQAVRVGLGTKEQALTPMGVEMGSAKSPFALIKGTNVGTPDDEVRRMMQEMMQDPNYTQIGMDPRKHSQFYDKSTGMPVFSAEEKLQSGPLILAPKKGLETTSWDDPRLNLSDFPGKKYAGGGNVISGLAKFLEGAKIPQRLYHGTSIAEENGAKALSQLKQSKEGALGAGVYMTPNTEFSNLYANQPGGYVMPVHTNLKNPLEIHSTQGGADPMKMALMQLGVPEAKAEQILEKAYDTRGYVGKEVMSRAQKQGYDGLAQYHDGNLSEVVSYNPYSIKSATGNTGEFNPYDPRLSKKTGGLV